MARQNNFKNYFSNLKDLYKTFYTSIWAEADPGVNIIQHFMTIVGTAALVMGTVTSVATGAIFPAVLMGLGAAATATDEVYHLIKTDNPPFIAKTLSNLVGSVIAPPLLFVVFPLVLGLDTVATFAKDTFNSIFHRSADKDMEKELSATHEATPSYEATPTLDQTNTPTHVATNEGIDLNNYYIEDESQATADNTAELNVHNDHVNQD